MIDRNDAFDGTGPIAPCFHEIPPNLAVGNFQALWPGRTVVRLGNAGHYYQEDAPDTLVSLFDQIIQSNP